MDTASQIMSIVTRLQRCKRLYRGTKEGGKDVTFLPVGDVVELEMACFEVHQANGMGFVPVFTQRGQAVREK